MFKKIRKKSFTLLELVLVITAVGILIPTIFSAYSKIQQTRKEIDVRQQLVQQTYEFFERMNGLIQDYTIDYEEYFNRQMVGCSGIGGASFERNTTGSGHCSNFTAYGNSSAIDSTKVPQHLFYYCSSIQNNNLPSYIKPLVRKPC